MKFQVAIGLEGRIVDILIVENVHDVMVSHDVYYLRDEHGQPLFSSPLAKTAYVQKVE